MTVWELLGITKDNRTQITGIDSACMMYKEAFWACLLFPSIANVFK